MHPDRGSCQCAENSVFGTAWELEEGKGQETLLRGIHGFSGLCDPEGPSASLSNNIRGLFQGGGSARVSRD